MLRYFVIIICFLILLKIESSAQNEKLKKSSYYFELGEDAIKNKSYKKALAHFNECLRLEPFYWDAYYSRAIVRERLEDLKGALTDYNIFLESKPDNAEALFTRAVLRYQNGQWAVAREDFLKLMKMPSGETNTIYFQLEKSGQASKVFTAQGEMRPTFLNHLALIDIKMNNYKRAISYLDSALYLLHDCGDCLINRGLAKQSARDTLGALTDYKSALKIDPENSLAMHNIALLSDFGDMKEAEQLLTKAIDKNPTLSYSHSERGYLRLKNGNLKGALTDLTEAIRLNPNEADDWLNRGMVKEKLRDLPGALADITNAIRIKSDFEKAWLCRGNIMSKSNLLKEAIEDYSVAIHHYPEYGLAFYNRALTYHKLGQLKEACADLLEAQKLEIKVDSKVSEVICK